MLRQNLSDRSYAATSVADKMSVDEKTAPSLDEPTERDVPNPGKSVVKDRFPKLNAFEKLARSRGKAWKSEQELGKIVSLIFKISPEIRERLIDYEYPHSIVLGEAFRQIVRKEIQSRPDGKFVFQNQKLFDNLNDRLLDPELPVCIVRIERSQDPSAKKNRNLIIGGYKLIHPITAERNFRGVRIFNESTVKFDLTARSLDCGFISDSRANDGYMVLETLHLYATIVFPFGVDER